MMMQAEVGVMCPGAKQCRPPLEAEKDKEWIFPWNLQKELSFRFCFILIKV